MAKILAASTISDSPRAAEAVVLMDEGVFADAELAAAAAAAAAAKLAAAASAADEEEEEEEDIGSTKCVSYYPQVSHFV